MAIVLGPKLGLLNNANIDETYYDQFRQFLQGMDALIMCSVLSTSVTVPPSSPNNGDAYLLLSGVSGAWTGFNFYLTVWDTQVTNSGTNTQVPQWVFYTPKAGWIIWNVATTTLLVNNGATWVNISTV